MLFEIHPKTKVKTNYDNLTSFETCAVIVAAIGLVLIGVQIFITLPRNSQVQVSDAFSIFDLHESVSQAGVGPQFVLGSMEEFYNQFDIAFAQVFSFPDSVGTPVIQFAESLGNYADSVGANYARANSQGTDDLGQVLGSFILNQQTQSVAPLLKATHTNHFNKQYYYHAPTMVQQLLTK